MSGETFEFQTSAKAGDGVFRFRWTLAPGKKGPPEHVHDDEAETFTVVTGTLRIWIDGTPRDLGPRDSVTVERLQRHRFLNPGPEPVVVDVSLDGPRQEDVLVPLAMYCGGRRTMKLRETLTLLVHSSHVRASRPPSRFGAAVFGGFCRVIRLFGVRPLAPVGGW